MRREALVWTARGMGLALGVGLVVGLGIIGMRAANVLVIVFVSILLASALEPFVGWLRARLGLGRGPTILVVYLSFVLLVSLLVVLILPTAIREAEALVNSLPPLLDQARAWAETLRPAALGDSAVAVINSIDRNFGPSPPPAADDVVEAGLTVAEFVVSLTTVMALVFFWLVEHARLQRYALAFIPARRRAGWREAWNEVETRLGLWVRGQLVLMFAIGIATGIAYWVLGVPSALLLAIFAGLAEAIPIIGPALGAVPAILVALTVSPELAITVAVVYVILQFAEGNILVPMVMKNTIGLSPFVVVIALLAGASAGGVAGAFLAVPIAAAMEVILERMQARAVPVAQEPGSSAPDASALEEQARSLPDAVGSAGASAATPTG